MKIHLEIKNKSLADEGKYISQRAAKLKAHTRNQIAWNSLESNKTVETTKEIQQNLQTIQSLREHKIQLVRPKARITHLALGFLNGKSYAEMENKTYNPPNFAAIEREVQRFSNHEEMTDYAKTHNQSMKTVMLDWYTDAKKHIESQQAKK